MRARRATPVAGERRRPVRGRIAIAVAMLVIGIVLSTFVATAPVPARAQLPTPDVARFEIGAADALGLIREASDLALAPDGSLYVVDRLSHRVQRFGSDGEPIMLWGGLGPEHGRFNGPSGVAVAADGTVYVADTGNDRVQQFDPHGMFLGAWGGDGGDGGDDEQLHQPAGIAIGLDGSVYVTDPVDHLVKHYTADGAFTRAFGNEGTAPERLRRPGDLAIGPDGSVYVIDFGNDRVQRFTAEGERIVSFGTAEPSDPHREDLWLRAIAVGSDGTVFAAKAYDVHPFDPAGRDLGKFSLSRHAIALEVDGANRLIAGIEPFGSVAIGVIDVSGGPPYLHYPRLSVQIGEPSPMDAPGQLSIRTDFYPPRTALSVAPDGRLYATDFESRRLQWFDPNGLFRGERAIEGVRDRTLGQGISVGAAPDGSAWVANAGAARLLHVDRDGATLAEFGVAGVDGSGRADGVAPLADGTLIVASAVTGRLQHLSADGRLLRAWGGRDGWEDFGPFGFCVDDDVFGVECNSQPLAVTADDNTIHVLDSAYGRVVRFTFEGEELPAFEGLSPEPEIQRAAQAIAAAPDGTLYAADTPSRHVVRFDRDGSIIGEIVGAPGLAPDRFDHPGGIAVSPDGGLVYVSDREYGRIIVYGVGPLPAWRAEYFGNAWLVERPLAIEEHGELVLDLDWGMAVPDPTLPPDGWSARFKRRLSLAPGEHNFALVATGGARLWIGGEILVDAWERGTISHGGRFEVPADGVVDAVLEVRDAGGPMAVRLAFDGDAPPPETPVAPRTPTAPATAGPDKGQVYLPSLEGGRRD